MKKLLTGIVAMALVFVLDGTAVFAVGPVCGRNFTDTGNERGCGYYNTACQFVDADGDGICDNYGLGGYCMGAGCGTGYVDADGDGICDNNVAGTLQNGTGSRRGHSRGQGGKGRCGGRR